MYIRENQALTSAGARAMLEAARTKASQMGLEVCIAIVDSGGHLLVLERMEGSPFHTVHSSTTKAVTAASNKRPTSAKGAQGQSLDLLHALGLALAAGPPRWTPMEGGYPIMTQEQCLGGIGVAGGDWQQDQQIALAALEVLEKNA